VLGTQNLDHQVNGAAAGTPSDHELGIAELEECSDIVVLGDAPEREAPVLKLRIYKAERKKGVKIHRMASAKEMPKLSGARFVGIVADESEADDAAELARALAAGNTRVARLTVTRGVNGRGAKDVGMTPHGGPGYAQTAKGLSGGEMLQGIADGKIRALLVLDGSALFAGAGEATVTALAGLESLVAIETRPGIAHEHATVTIPGHAYLEKAGTVTNMEGRVQRIRPALPPATQTPSEVRIISMLATQLGATGWAYADPVATHKEMAAAIPAYAQAGNGGRAVFSRVTAQ
jgi:predicted molibdopterin-dependent oxidoreductase YjgC